MSRNQQLGYAFGAIYALVGLVGFAVTAGVGFAGTQGKEFLVFSLNPLHNVIHLAVGALLFLGARGGTSVSRKINLLVGTVYLLVGIVGLFIIGAAANILALNHPDNLLHLATAALALGVGASETGVVTGSAGRQTKASGQAAREI